MIESMEKTGCGENARLPDVHGVFGIEPHTVERRRNCSHPVYRLESREGSFCLKCHGTDIDGIRRVIKVLGIVRDHGFSNYPEFVTFRPGGTPLVAVDGIGWTLSRWIEPDPRVVLSSIDVAVSIAKSLGMFHSLGTGIAIGGDRKKAMMKIASIVNTCRYVISVREDEMGEGEVPSRFREVLPSYRTEARRVLELLQRKSDAVQKMWRTAERTGTLVRGDVSPENIICTGDGTVYFVDWDDCTVGARVDSDLVQLFWRIARPTGDCRTIIDAYLDSCSIPPEHLVLYPLFASAVHIYAHYVKKIMNGEREGPSGDEVEVLLDAADEMIEAPWDIAMAGPG